MSDHNDLYLLVGEVKSTCESTKELLESHITSHLESHAELDARLRRLEKLRTQVMTLVAAGSAMVTFSIKHFWVALASHFNLGG